MFALSVRYYCECSQQLQNPIDLPATVAACWLRSSKGRLAPRFGQARGVQVVVIKSAAPSADKPSFCVSTTLEGNIAHQIFVYHGRHLFHFNSLQGPNVTYSEAALISLSIPSYAFRTVAYGATNHNTQ
jgi:hypothetical protein